LAADVPIVASDLHENPHFFKHRVNGMLVKTHEQYVEAIRELVRDDGLRDAIADNGHASFSDELSIDAIAKRTDRLFRELIGERANERSSV
jgi:glycosyltransferase involved in cell wall biosynthesis